MNPHKKESWFLHYLGEKDYVNDEWHDTGLWVEVGGLGLIMCTISMSERYSCNIGFRIVDEANKPLLPYRKNTNARHPVHFSSEINLYSFEDLVPLTFHMIANCQYAKLQIRPSDGGKTIAQRGRIRINAAGKSDQPTPDEVWNHKTISTMSVIPLIPIYQPGANTIFTYPQSRMPRMSEDDKPPVIHKDKITSSSP